MRQLEQAEVVASIGEAELAAQAFQFHVADHQVGLRGDAVGDDRALDVGNDGLDVGLVQAKDGGAVERNAIHEFGEAVLDIFQGGVLIEMLAVDGGDHGDDWREQQEAAVALVGFHDEKLAFAEALRWCRPGSRGRR